MELKNIIKAVNSDRLLITKHAWVEAASDGFNIGEIIASLNEGFIIEEYTEDLPFPSCLILSFNGKSEPIHSVWAYNPLTESAVLITVYKPDPKRWIDWKKRRK